MKRKVVCLLMAALLVIQFMPHTFAAENLNTGSVPEGRFVFAAAKAGKVVIKPTRFDYSEGQTVYDVLMSNPDGHSFREQSSGFINIIDGVEGNYNRYDDQGGYALDTEASDVNAFFFVEFELSEENAPAFGDMLKAMADYNSSENGVEKFAPAAEAYAAANNALLGAKADYSALKANLSKAMQDYNDTVLNARKYSVALDFRTITGAALNGYAFTVDDSYGNVFAFNDNEEVVLPARDYYFTLKKGNNSARGTMTVTAPENAEGKAKVSIEGEDVGWICLYDGKSWMGEIDFLNKNGGTVEENAYPKSGNTYFIPDNMTRSNIYVQCGEGIDEKTYNHSAVSLYPIYTTVQGKELCGGKKAWESRYSSVTKLVAAGSGDTSLTMEARLSYGGYTLVESRDLTIKRTPTLQGLSVTADGAEQKTGFEPLGESYELTVCTDSIKVSPALYNWAKYEVSVNEEPLKGSTMEISLLEAETSVVLNLKAPNGEIRNYTLTVHKVDAVNVTVEHASDTTVEIKNSVGALIGAYDQSKTSDTFHLVEGERYTCISGKDEYYHASVDFTAQSGLVMTAPLPDTTDLLTGLGFRSHSSLSKAEVYMPVDKDVSSNHLLNVTVPDRMNYLCISASVTAGTLMAVETESKITTYTQEKLETNAVSIGNYLEYGDKKQTLTFRISNSENDVTKYQNYVVNFVRSLSLKGLQLVANGESVSLYQEENGNLTTNTEFKPACMTYGTNISSALETMTLMVEPYSKDYYIYVNNKEYLPETDSETGERGEKVEVVLDLDYTKVTENFDIRVESDAECSVPQTYTVTLYKKAPISTGITINDADTGQKISAEGKVQPLAVVYDSMSGERIWPDENGKFSLIDTMSYRVVATCYGYVGSESIITAESDKTDISISLTKAPAQSERQNLDSSWPSFRGSDDANGVVNFKTPIKAEDAALSWASKLGDGYSADAVSCPIIITENGYEYLIVYAGTNIYKVDALSGETVAEGEMDHKSSFAINSATYAEGMIFVGLANGTVQAFDAVTLKSLWIYKNSRGGQPNCPITYSNGYIYTGFWNSETKPADFVCISVTDEDPTKTNEQKLASWTHTDNGFYWAGSYVDPEGKFLLVGTDDGDSGYLKYSARLLCLNPQTGEVLDTIDEIRGDLRSNVSYDSETGRYFFTSKGGYFYSVKMTEKDGNLRFDDNSFLQIYLDNYGNDTSNPPMSTCTPVVYNGRAYIGVSGVAQFGAYSGHNITVIDLSTWTIAYSVPTQGYPQTSGLLTTAYEETDGYVYVYFFDNFTPGKLRALKDKKGQTAPVVTTPEEGTYQGVTKTYNTPYVLFTPAGDQAQYAICSPIADAYGTLYFKNDSAYLMALTNRITKLEITKAPDKTEYEPGESFDPTGMEIKLTYANGLTREIPATRTVNGKKICYISWTENPEGFTSKDTETTIRFAYVMYQNGDDGEVGRTITSPYAKQEITVKGSEAVLGDVNGDENINAQDVQMIRNYILEKTTLTEAQMNAADVNKDGKVNAQDVQKLRNYLMEKISTL